MSTTLSTTSILLGTTPSRHQRKKISLMDIDYIIEKSFTFKFLRDTGLYELFKKYKIVLAGGAIVSIIKQDFINDHDLYLKDKSLLNDFLFEFTNKFNVESVYSSTSANTYRFKNQKFQIVILEEAINKTAREIINTFDFSVCQGAYDFEYDGFVFGDKFLDDINTRKMHYNIDSKYPISSLFRYRKYINKGFHFSTVEILKIVYSIQQLKINTYLDVAKSLNSVSTVKFADLIILLKSDYYKNKTFELHEFFEFADEYFESEEIIDALTE